MRRLRMALSRARRDERGLETLEYAIVAGFIVVGTVAAIAVVSVWVAGAWASFRTTVGS